MSYKIFQLRVTHITKKEFEVDIFGALEKRERQTVVTCLNPHSYVISKCDVEFHRALISSDFCIPDGIGISFLLFLMGYKNSERITGSDLFELTMNYIDRVGGRVFLFGSTDETLRGLERTISVNFPNVIIAGSFSPPFAEVYTPDQNRKFVELINSSRPDVLWVAMTAPKQEKWVAENRDALQVRFIGSVGAVFDFYSGSKKRANQFFQRMNLEWLVRFALEPRRMWRRIFISGFTFIVDSLRLLLSKF